VPVAWIALLLGLFTAGGLIFGLVFLRNVRLLASRGVTVSAAIEREIPPAVEIAQLPSRVASQVKIAPPRLPDVRPPDIPNPLPALPVAIPAAIPNPLPSWSGTDRVNILLLGIDRRPEEDPAHTRTDTIIVVSVDPVERSAVMISFPRDLWVSIPGYGEQRINVAHEVGGPELTARTLQANFGVRVDYWARIDFVGFTKIVDTLGGVLVDVERPIKDDEYPTEDYGYQRIYIGAGPQLMDGRTALQYARSRHSENDFGRAHRQQRVLIAMRDRALALNMLPRIPTLLGEAQETVATDMSTATMIGLARLASDLDGNKVSSVVLDVRYAVPFIGENGANLLSPDRAAIGRVIARIEAGQDPEPARIEVLNGSETEGLAARTADYLGARGYDIARVAPAERTNYQAAEIVVLAGRRASAEYLASALSLPSSAIRAEAAKAGDPDLRLVVGNGFQLPGTQ
jgi:LCP family protein required for cell wall assembly